MAIGEGCRRSFLVDVWGSNKFRRIVVAVNRERKKETCPIKTLFKTMLTQYYSHTVPSALMMMNCLQNSKCPLVYNTEKASFSRYNQNLEKSNIETIYHY